MEGNSISINGSGSINGGDYDKVRINGAARCTGDIKANSIRVNGSFSMKGRVECSDFIEVNGSAGFQDSVWCKKIVVSGSSSVEGNLEADHVKCNGSVKCGKQISGDLVECYGMMTAEEIVGEKVLFNYESKKWSLFDFFRKKITFSEIGMIEATEINVNGIRCKNLNGHNVTIGPECEIENVDCTGNLMIAPEAQVKMVNGQPR